MEGASSHCNPKPTIFLRIIYYNARSLLPKLDELRAVTEAENLDIVCIVETWLSNEISDSELTINNYQILRLDRDRHGGGVIMYIHSSLTPKVLSAGANTLSCLSSLFHLKIVLVNYVLVCFTDHLPLIQEFLTIFAQLCRA